MLWEELRWPEVEECAREGFVAVLPCGSMEQHGPHCPVQVDTCLVSAVARRAAERVPGVVVTPTFWSGYSMNHRAYPGTLTLGVESYLGAIKDLGRSVVRCGFRKLVLLNGHGGNRAVLQVTAQELRWEFPDRQFLTVTYWDLVRERAMAIRESEVGGCSHAGEFETSVMLHLRPDLVAMEEALRNPRVPKLSQEQRDMFILGVVMRADDFGDRKPTGVAGDPTVASAEKGERFLEAAVEGLCALLEEVKRL